MTLPTTLPVVALCWPDPTAAQSLLASLQRTPQPAMQLWQSELEATLNAFETGKTPCPQYVNVLRRAQTAVEDVLGMLTSLSPTRTLN